MHPLGEGRPSGRGLGRRHPPPARLLKRPAHAVGQVLGIARRAVDAIEQRALDRDAIVLLDLHRRAESLAILRPSARFHDRELGPALNGDACAVIHRQAWRHGDAGLHAKACFRTGVDSAGHWSIRHALEEAVQAPEDYPRRNVRRHLHTHPAEQLAGLVDW